MLQLPARAWIALRDGFRWSRIRDSGPLLAIGYGLATALALIGVGLASSPPAEGALRPAISVVLVVLSLNLVLILGLSMLVGSRVLQLQQSGEVGSRLRLRFIGLFAIAAVVPGVVVALVFGVLVTRGVDGWFSQRVKTVVENSATVARSYVDEQTNYIRDHVTVMAVDLNRAAPGLRTAPVAFSHFLSDLASYHAFPAAYLIDRDGRILARAETAEPPTFLMPPQATMKAADEGDLVLRPFESADLIRAVYRLKAYPDAYLYIVRKVDKGILNHLRETETSLNAYRESARSRSSIQAAFSLSYLETALLLVVGAVWLGMSAANRIAVPVARLVQAANRIAEGDLDARVDTSGPSDELGLLNHAFNRMTADLKAQRKALIAASLEADGRRQFIETVLSGVSAGVIGVNADGRISAANRQAERLLAIVPETALGQALAAVAPEFGPLFDQAALGTDVEGEVDLARPSGTFRLRVRASVQPGSGIVLTFDDITGLVAAQRTAAWKDVARRIAHEIKNPLTPIQLSAERLRRKYRKEVISDPEIFDRCTETIIRQVGDIGRMVDEFSAFARLPAPVFEDTDLAELVRRSVFSQRVVSPEIDLTFEDPESPILVHCDTRMIGQALANVLKNAAEAVSACRTRDGLPAEPGKIDVGIGIDSRWAIITVTDNGVGLPTKDRDRLTEPYVTTREKGTGLGLAIVKRILEDHGGSLKLQDAPQGRGAQVQFKLPTGNAVDLQKILQQTAKV